MTVTTINTMELLNKTVQARLYSKRMWQSIAEALNSQGEGALKDWKGWSNYWVDYKAKLKRKAAADRLSRTQTGGGPSHVAPLSEIDRKFLSLLGENFGVGLPNVQVNPFPNVTQSSTSTAVQSPPPDSAPLYDLVIEELPQPQVESLQETLPALATAPAPPPPPTHPVRRRRSREHISKEESRRTLVELGQSKIDLIKQHTEQMKKQTDIMEKILHTLNKIADKLVYKDF